MLLFVIGMLRMVLYFQLFMFMKTGTVLKDGPKKGNPSVQRTNFKLRSQDRTPGFFAESSWGGADNNELWRIGKSEKEGGAGRGGENIGKGE